MARNIKKLPKWAIKQAGGINKKAWALARRGRPSSRKKTPAKKNKRRRSVARKKNNSRKPMGMLGKLNGILRGIKIGLPAIRSFTAGLSPGDAAKDAAARYTGFDFENMQFDQGKATATVGFYAGNMIEQKVLSGLRIPQMAGRKKLLAIGGQYLPEIQAGSDLMAGADLRSVGSKYSRRSIGYGMNAHNSWLENPGTRSEFFQTLLARVGLGLASKFVGPMVNKHLPKGVNI